MKKIIVTHKLAPLELITNYCERRNTSKENLLCLLINYILMYHRIDRIKYVSQNLRLNSFHKLSWQSNFNSNDFNFIIFL